jgi:serine/threonine protein phosphatase PrpC
MKLSGVQGAYFTHQGLVREHNEDSLWVQTPISLASMDAPVSFNWEGSNPWILCVADGIGGANAGERASFETVDRIGKLQKFSAESLACEIRAIHRHLWELGRSDESLRGLGSTVAGMGWNGSELLVFHVGDCRVYRQRDGFFQMLTRDDTTAQVLVDLGKVPADEIRHENLHSLTQALGGRDEWRDIEPHVEVVKIQSSSRFFICSDGITDFLDLDVLEAAVLPEMSTLECAGRIAACSARTPQKDNLSFLLIDVLFATL